MIKRFSSRMRYIYMFICFHGLQLFPTYECIVKYLIPKCWYEILITRLLKPSHFYSTYSKQLQITLIMNVKAFVPMILFNRKLKQKNCNMRNDDMEKLNMLHMILTRFCLWEIFSIIKLKIIMADIWIFEYNFSTFRFTFNFGETN